MLGNMVKTIRKGNVKKKSKDNRIVSSHAYGSIA